MVDVISVLSVFVLRAELRGREASTIATYNTEYKRLVKFYRRFGKMVCVFDERDVVLYIIWRSKQGVSETQLKHVLAVISLLCEVCGFESPSKSPVVAKVKMTIIKEANEGKKKIESYMVFPALWIGLE